MSDKESKFIDTNPENQKPHNISGKNPRSVQTLHKSQVKPRSQDKDIEIEFEENTDTVYKTKTTYLVQKAKMQLKRRVAPGVSEIIIRKNEEKRKLAEEQAKKEAEIEEETDIQDEEIVETEDISPETETIEETEEEPEQEPVETTNETTGEATSTKTNLSSDGKSFTQMLREQGLIYGQKISEAVEKAKPEIEATINETKTIVNKEAEKAKNIVNEEAEKAKSEPSTEGKSFTQVLREQGFIEGQKIINAVEKAKPEIEATINEAKTTVEKIVEEATQPEETQPEEPTTPGKSFTQSLREEGFIQTETGSTAAPKSETKEIEEEKDTAVELESEEETISEDKEEENKTSDDEVKTFIDLIRSEGLL